jgi:hypothetical protein
MYHKEGRGKNQLRLKLNGTHQLLVYVDDVNLMGHNIDTIQKNTGTLIDASKEVREKYTQKTKYMLSRHQNAVQNHDIKITDASKMCHNSNIWERQ